MPTSEIRQPADSASSSLYRGTVRVTQWDPWLLMSQIVCIQCSLYTVLAVFVLISSQLMGQALGLSLVWDWKMIGLDTVFGWLLCSSFLSMAVIGSYLLRFLVKRAKLCLDFTGTFYFYHFLFTWHYSGFPTGATWWFLFLGSLIGMAMLGEYLCMRKEMEPILLAGTGGGGASDDRERASTSLDDHGNTVQIIDQQTTPSRSQISSIAHSNVTTANASSTQFSRKLTGKPGENISTQSLLSSSRQNSVSDLSTPRKTKNTE